jgi:hypothetical protein
MAFCRDAADPSNIDRRRGEKPAPGERTISAKKTTKTAAAKKPVAKAAAKTKTPKPAGKMSVLVAAAKFLGESGEPMNCKMMIEAMAAKNYCTSPGGATPHAPLYSALLREINTKGKDLRFVKTERGNFGVKK